MIGVFDSGSGGITILEALRQHLPGEDFLYLGDHANAPYGHRSNAQIVNLTQQAVATLMQEGCSLVILACNTAAAVALRTLQQDWLPDNHPDRRILGVLVPMVEALTGVPWSQEEPVNKTHPTQNILLFATRKTVESGAYRDEVKKRAPHVNLYGKACPGLVDAIEGGAGHKPLSGLIAGYVSEAKPKQPDAVVLGCTHFPLVKEHFAAELPPETPIYSQPEIVAASLADYLERHPDLRTGGSGKLDLMTTANPEDVNAISHFLPKGFGPFRRVR